MRPKVYFWDEPGHCDCESCPPGKFNYAYIVVLPTNVEEVAEMVAEYGPPDRIEESSHDRPHRENA